jgi:hypothetical protein
MKCLQSSYWLLHKQFSFVPPYHCVWLAPVNARLCTSIAIAICLAFDIRFSATFCSFQHMLSKVPLFHCSFSIRYSLRSLSSNCCVKHYFQLLVIFVPLMKRAHRYTGYNPQFGLATSLPVAVSLIISYNSSATMSALSSLVVSMPSDSACRLTHAYWMLIPLHHSSCKFVIVANKSYSLSVL